MNKILLINKPMNMTSFDVVNKVKRALKVKVGHCGTLDPNATGLLVLLIGNATKLLNYLNVDEKTYEASVQLGRLTDTQDIWGKVVAEKDIVPFTPEQFNEALASFVGHQVQKTPIVSAVKVNGKKLYEYHRQNIEIDTPEREIEIKELNGLHFNEQSFSFKAVVSKGTYIRTLSVDIAQKLGNYACMSSLVRTKVGCFDLKDAIELDDLSNVNSKLIDLNQALSHLTWIELEEKHKAINGMTISHEYCGDLVVISYQNRPIAIYRYDETNQNYRCERGGL